LFYKQDQPFYALEAFKRFTELKLDVAEPLLLLSYVNMALIYEKINKLDKALLVY